MLPAHVSENFLIYFCIHQMEMQKNIVYIQKHSNKHG